MPRERNKQKQLWSDLDFIRILEQIKAKRLLNGNPVRNLGQLTKEMLKCPSFKRLEEELVRINEIKARFKIKLDRKNLSR